MQGSDNFQGQVMV